MLVGIFLIYWGISHPTQNQASRVETIAYGRVVATEWDGNFTTVTFDDNYQLKMNGYIQLEIPREYEFSFYNDVWHFEGVYKAK